jgi:hypothetical protein
MSYSGTVYCGYCGGRGHNKRGCEQRKEYIANNPTSWTARREAEAAERRKQRKRVCSYCCDSGHNTRTCPTKKEDQHRLVAHLKDERETFLLKMKELGWGVGALYNRQGRWGDVPQAYMIHKILWANIVDGEQLHFQSMSMANAVGGMINSYDYPRLWDGNFALTHLVSDKLLLCRSDNVQPPVGWINGTLYEKEDWFPTGQSRQAWVYNLLDKE